METINSQKLSEKNYAETEKKAIIEIDELLKNLLPVQAEYYEIKMKLKDFDKEQIEKKFHTNREKISKQLKKLKPVLGVKGVYDRIANKILSMV